MTTPNPAADAGGHPAPGAPAPRPLSLSDDPVRLTAALVDIPSPSRSEGAIAGAVEAALRETVGGFSGPGAATEVERIGNSVVARTHRGLGSRVVLAGHLDTVPVAENLPSAVRTDSEEPGGEPVEKMYGCGTSDMKSGDAVFLHLFAALADAPELAHDLTLLMYDCEEIEAPANGLGVLQRSRPELLEGDLAILGEPTDGLIEAGCQGTLRLRVHASGVRAHSARSWLGVNAIHGLAPVLAALDAYAPRDVAIDGCTYREGLQAVRISGGVAGNVVPDTAWVDVNFRFAPDRSEAEALRHAVDALGLDPARRFGTPAESSDRSSGRPSDTSSDTASPGPAEPIDPWSVEACAPLEEAPADARVPAPTSDGAGADRALPAPSWQLTDMSPAALPGLSNPAAASLVRAAGGAVRAKYGWTDVSRFAAAGVAAVNLGPGDPGTAHKRDEFCRTRDIVAVTDVLRRYLTGGAV